MIAIATAFLIWRPDPFRNQDTDTLLRRSKAATQYASEVCKPDLSVLEKQSISTDVAASLRRLTTDSKANRETLSNSINHSLSDQSQLVLDDRIRGCMVAQASWHIATEGGSIKGGGRAPSWPPAGSINGSGTASRGDVREARPPIADTRPVDDGPEGFVYFEERNGRATEDGRFVPVDGMALPAYGAIKVGQVLEALGTARMRRGPGTEFQIVTNIAGRDCVRVLTAPSNEVRVTGATSGGHLRVRQIACPVLHPV